MADKKEHRNGVNAVSNHVPRSRPMFSTYVVALRPWSFTISLTPVGLGSILAYKAFGAFNPWIFIIVCITALAVHAAGNLVNTYYDYLKGVDTKKSDDRTLVDHALDPNDVATMAGVLYCIGCAGFVVMVLLSPTPMEHLALIYFGGLSSSFLYTGGLGLKYLAMGDVIIFLTFGPITVLFAYLAQGGALSWMPLIYAMPLALNSEAILHSNNTRDMDTDRRAGIVTLAIILGRTGSYCFFMSLLLSPYAAFGLLALHCSKWFLLPLSTIFMALKREKEFRSGDLRKMPGKIAVLNVFLGTFYIVALGFTTKQDLPGL